MMLKILNCMEMKCMTVRILLTCHFHVKIKFKKLYFLTLKRHFKKQLFYFYINWTDMLKSKKRVYTYLGII